MQREHQANRGSSSHSVAVAVAAGSGRAMAAAWIRPGSGAHRDQPCACTELICPALDRVVGDKATLEDIGLHLVVGIDAPLLCGCSGDLRTRAQRGTVPQYRAQISSVTSGKRDVGHVHTMFFPAGV